MENETVGVIAELLLLGEIEHYSTMRTTTVNQGTISSVQNQGSAGAASTGAGPGGEENTWSAPILPNLRKTEKDDGEGPEDKHSVYNSNRRRESYRSSLSRLAKSIA